jgi:hypothetical protein
VSGVVSNLEMIYTTEENVWRLFADTAPFYLRDLCILGLWYLGREGDPGTHPTQILQDDYKAIF